MYILNPNEFREVMMARDIEDTYSLITQANSQMTQWMIRMLDTDISEVVGEDYYYADMNRLGSQHPFYMLYLERGFLKKTVPVEILVAEDFRKWDEAIPVDPLTVKVDYDKGYVTIVDKFPVGKYLKVTYAAGYGVEDVTVDSLPTISPFKVFTGLPSWMTSITLTGAIELYKGYKNWERAPDKVKVKQKVSLTVTGNLDIEELLVPYLRFAPYALKKIDL